MNLTVSQEQGRVPITVFRIEGRINLGNAEALREAARAAVQNGMRYLLIDLTDVPSMTTEGLRALHYIYLLLGDDSSEQPGQETPTEPDATPHTSPYLKLLNPSPHIRHVLNTAGFSDFIELHDNRDAAITSF
jgi:anti-anti-sigma regulatory factor